MLVLTRKIGERVVIDNGVVVEVLGITGNRIRLGIQAPASVTVRREELPVLKAEAGNTSEEVTIRSYQDL